MPAMHSGPPATRESEVRRFAQIINTRRPAHIPTAGGSGAALLLLRDRQAPHWCLHRASPSHTCQDSSQHVALCKAPMDSLPRSPPSPRCTSPEHFHYECQASRASMWRPGSQLQAPTTSGRLIPHLICHTAPPRPPHGTIGPSPGIGCKALRCMGGLQALTSPRCAAPWHSHQ
jgi:hypothetical protein